MRATAADWDAERTWGRTACSARSEAVETRRTMTCASRAYTPSGRSAWHTPRRHSVDVSRRAQNEPTPGIVHSRSMRSQPGNDRLEAALASSVAESGSAATLTAWEGQGSAPPVGVRSTSQRRVMPAAGRPGTHRIETCRGPDAVASSLRCTDVHMTRAAGPRLRAELAAQQEGAET